MSGSDDKTEQPTAKRLRDARKKGQVAKSKDVPSAAVIVLLMLFLWYASDYYMDKLEQLLNLPIWLESVPFASAFNDLVREVLQLGLAMVLPVVGLAALAGILGNFFQVGVLFAPEAVKPDLKKLNPGAALKNIFSKKNAIELLKSMVKISIMTYLIGYVIWTHAPSLLRIPYCGIDCVFVTLELALLDVIVYASMAFIIVAALDYAFQKFEYIKGLKMSKDEIKREYKESEGDPQIKSRRRQLFLEIVSSQQTSNIKRSSLIVSNPTHVAVGLYYEQEKTPLPIVTLKEQGLHALRVIEIAEKEGVPVMQNIPLAHSLLEECDLDNYIPDTLIAPVAEVLRLVRGM